ncbi:MAG TPA: hypothetical protein VJ553_05340 [Candidatus Paceibacterota bacterium]|nr:hypothetical protein [Candidatus Paceibacterota bacterium]
MTEQQERLLQQVATDVAVLKGAVIGNGTKGLSERASDVEEWQSNHPRDCPLPAHIGATEDTPRQGRANRWVVIGVVISAVMGTAGLAVGILK